jgi:hypothetical protein
VIDQADARLSAWTKQVLEISNITLAPPSNSQEDEGVSLYLLDLTSAVPPNGAGRPPLQISLRYLVTTWAKTPETAHRWLGMLAFAAMESSEYEVELAPQPYEVWLALGASPRPAFILKVRIRLERPEPTVPLVRAPLNVQTSAITQLDGRVLGPDDFPIADARIEISSLQQVEHTDSKGWFRFRTVPADFRPATLKLSAKGRQVNVVLEPAQTSDKPLLIRFDPTIPEAFVQEQES